MKIYLQLGGPDFLFPSVSGSKNYYSKLDVGKKFAIYTYIVSLHPILKTFIFIVLC